MIKDKYTNSTIHQEALPQKQTLDGLNESYKTFTALRANHYRKGIEWLSQFVKKDDAIKPKFFASMANIRPDHFSQILNGKCSITQEMYTRIAIGIGLKWDEIVKFRLAKFTDKKERCLSKQAMEDVKQKRINDLKDEFIHHFGIDARTFLDMLDKEENLVHLSMYYNEKYTRRFKKK